MRYTKTALILIVIFLASCSSTKKVKDHIVDCSLIETPSKDVNLAQLEEDLLLIRSQLKKNSSQQQALISKQVESNANLQGCPIDSRGFKVMSCVNFHAKFLKKYQSQGKKLGKEFKKLDTLAQGKECLINRLKGSQAAEI